MSAPRSRPPTDALAVPSRVVLAAACLVATAGVQVVSAAPAAAVPGLSRVVSASVSNSADKTQSAHCPAGKVVIGGGGFVTGGLGQVGIDRSTPLTTGTSYSVTAREDGNGFAGNWSVTAIAFCATPTVGLTYVSATTAPSSLSSRTVSAFCATGRSVLGLGAFVTSGAGQVVLDGVQPAADLKSATASAYEDDSGYAGNWSLTAVAVCSVAPAGLQRVVASSTATSASPRSATATCPAGKSAHGAGLEFTGGLGQVLLDDLNATATAVSATGYEDETGFAGNWSVASYVICAS
jgi:hypothetical protein